ncbi:MAG: 3-deoxy-7-phosphoheptulonate synthase [Gammaproteobacteria bacterium]
MLRTDDVRIVETREVIAPQELLRDVPLGERASQTVFFARRALQNVLAGTDDRLLVVVGPCSIHDPEAAHDYAGRLKVAANAFERDLLIVMRVYFEKPRTTIGWKGLINDPGLDESFRINDGLHIARRLLVDLNEMGMPAATEFLDPISPQYVADLIAWGAIGARTTESQVHRELASGLSCPVGFKNATDGGIQIAVDAIRAAANRHHFLGVTKSGHTAIVETAGNPDCHLILRGGNNGPNYSPEHIEEAAGMLRAAGLPARIIVDCSHANSGKSHERQSDVGREVAAQIARGDRRIVGVMLESFIASGRQDLKPGKALAYGQSITDACMGWEETEAVLAGFGAAAAARRGG